MQNYISGLIQKIGLLLGIDASYLARGSFWTTVQFIVSSGLAFLSVYVFANYLPSYVYGQYKYIISVAGIFGFFSLTGMNNAVTQTVAQGNDSTYRYAVRYQLKWNLLVLVTSALAALYYFANDNSILAVSLLIIGSAFPFTAAFNTYGAYLLGKKALKLGTIYALITNIINTVPIMIGILFTENIVILVTLYTLGGLIPNALFHFYTLAKFKPPKARLTREQKDVIWYGTHLSVLAGISNIASNIDKVVLFHYLGAVEVAIYALATAIPNRIAGYMKNIGALLLPKLAEKSVATIGTSFHKRILQTTALGATIAFGYIALAPLIFAHFLPQYLASIRYSQVLALAFIFQAAGNYIGNVFRAQKMIRSAYLGSTQSIIRAVLYVVLGSTLGIWGIIIATLSTNVIGFFASLILWHFEKKYQLKNLSSGATFVK